MLTEELAVELSGAKRIAILGVGSELRRDDGVGLEIVKRLKNNVPAPVKLIECGTVPESFIDPVSKWNPTHILIIDSAEMGKPPGTSELIKTENITGISLSTHHMPLSILIKYLESTTGAKVVLLGIQPQDITFGEGLTTIIQKTAREIVKILKEVLVIALKGSEKHKPQSKSPRK
ncbi:MAG: hydrogenase maturation peptidase HycI [Candidatus Hodarchaeota archaeon]